MTHPQTMCIVGGGLAAARAAATLRDEGFDGGIVLIRDETSLPYERPPLTKSYLAGTSDERDTYAFPPEYYDAHEIELIRATASVLGPGLVELDDRRSIEFDSLLVASGSAARRLDVPGERLGNVLSIRTLDDAHRARRLLLPGANVVCIGAGWIGLEVAATSRRLGCTVTVVGPDAVPLSKVLGSEIGGFYRRAHEDQGVTFKLGRSVVELLGVDVVHGVALDDGTWLAADVVIVGIGATPRVSLLEAAGADLALGGIATDAGLRTSLPNVFAAGDIAAAEHPLYGHRVRVEHWANALHQGPCAARNMLGGSETYARLPYFYSDQYDLSMEYAGLALSWSNVVIRPGEAEPSFSAFWVDDSDVVLAGMTMNLPGGIDEIEALLRRQQPVRRAALADPAVPLALTTMVRAASS